MHRFSAESPIIGRFSRRAILGALASVPAIGASAALVVLPAHDPLLDAIGAYRAGLADFNAYSPEDDDAADASKDARPERVLAGRSPTPPALALLLPGRPAAALASQLWM